MNFEVTNTVKHPELFVGNSWTLPTDIGLVTEAEEAFVDKLEECEWDKTSDDVNKLQIAFREAIINAIAHGNLHLLNKPEGSTDNWGQLSKKEQELHPTDKKIFINIEVSKTKVMLTIRDEGDGFNWMQAPDPTIGASLLEPDGRGMLFMRMYFDTIEYNEKGNQVTMTKIRILPGGSSV